MDQDEIFKTLDRLSRVRGALELLGEISRLAPNDIPLDWVVLGKIVTDGADGLTSDEARELIGTHLPRPDIEALRKAGLIEVNELTISLRDGVKAATRQYLSDRLRESHNRLADTIVRNKRNEHVDVSELRSSAVMDRFLLGTIEMADSWFPTDVSDRAKWPFCERMLPHGFAAVAEVRESLLVNHSNYWESSVGIKKDAFGGGIADLSSRMSKYLEATDRLPEARELRLFMVSVNGFLFGLESPELVNSLENLASFLERTGDFSAACDALQRAIDAAERSDPAHRYEIEVFDSPATADYAVLTRLHRKIGDLYLRIGATDRARESLTRAARIAAHRLSSIKPDKSLLTGLSNLGSSLKKCGEIASARAVIEQAIGMSEPAPPTDFNTAILQHKLATILVETGNVQEGIEAFSRAIKIEESRQNPDDPRLGRLYRELGDAYIKAEDFARAEESLRTSVEIGSKYLPANDEPLGVRYALLGLAANKTGNVKQARAAYERALEIGISAFGPTHQDVKRRFDALIGIARAHKDPEAMATATNVMINAEGAVHGDESFQVARLYSRLGQWLLDLADLPASQKAQERAVQIFEAIGQGGPDFSRALNSLALAVYRMGDKVRALELMERTVKIDDAITGEPTDAVAVHLGNYGRFLRDAGRADEAIAILGRAVAIREASGQSNSRAYGDDVDALGMLYLSRGAHQTARPLLESALEIIRRELGESSPRTQRLIKALDAYNPT